VHHEALSAAGELLTHATAWVAVFCYAAALGTRPHLRAAGGQRLSRLLWTAGLAACLLHAACAFGFYHDWSHDAALRHTAARTAQRLGMTSGAGLYVNYLFALAWLADTAWWWLAPASRARRPRAAAIALHLFLGFVVFNAAVVFAGPLTRWIGLGTCLVLGACLLRRPRSPAAAGD
jgi:hypothetical protein